MFLRKNQSFKSPAKYSRRGEHKCQHLPPTAKNNINLNYFWKLRLMDAQTRVNEVKTSLEKQSSFPPGAGSYTGGLFTPEPRSQEGERKAESANRRYWDRGLRLHHTPTLRRGGGGTLGRKETGCAARTRLSSEGEPCVVGPGHFATTAAAAPELRSSPPGPRPLEFSRPRRVSASCAHAPRPPGGRGFAHVNI